MPLDKKKKKKKKLNKRRKNVKKFSQKKKKTHSVALRHSRRRGCESPATAQ